MRGEKGAWLLSCSCNIYIISMQYIMLGFHYIYFVRFRFFAFPILRFPLMFFHLNYTLKWLRKLFEEHDILIDILLYLIRTLWMSDWLHCLNMASLGQVRNDTWAQCYYTHYALIYTSEVTQLVEIITLHSSFLHTISIQYKRTLSQNVVHLSLIEIRTQNICGDGHWLHI